MINPHSIAVIYIARKSNAGLISLMRFTESIAQYSAGIKYELIIIAKGWENDSVEFHRVQTIGKSIGAEVVILPDEGYDWGVYFRIARILKHPKICFFNSHSAISSDNWLLYLESALNLEGVGIAGATGSYGSWSFSFPYLNKDLKSFVLYPFRVIKSLLMSLLHFGDSLSFPCLHLRSNAFITRRESFLEFSDNSKIPKNKRGAHALESGLHSLTSFFHNKGLRAVVVGKNGKAYLPDEWPASQTFRVPGQSNLLVCDNQTNNYEVANVALKRRLEWAAWGRLYS